MSTADEIKKLNDLLRDRVITQEEFDSQKEKLLDSSTKTNSIDWLASVSYTHLTLPTSFEV